MEVKKAKIGNALTSSAANHVVAVSEDIYDESKGRYQSDINEDAVKAKVVANKAAADIGVNSTTLLQGGIDAGGSENSSSYYLRTSCFSTFKLEVNDGYTVGQIAQYDLSGNFVALYNDYTQMSEGVEWTPTSVVATDKEYMWVAIVFKGNSPSTPISPREDVVKTFVSGLHYYMQGGEGDANSAAAQAKAIIDNTIEQLPNEDDLTFSNEGKMQFANRTAEIKDDKVSSLGYVVLRKNKSFAEQVKVPNTIYEIRYNFDLQGGTIELQDNCILKFSGGKINNGILSNIGYVRNGSFGNVTINSFASNVKSILCSDYGVNSTSDGHFNASIINKALNAGISIDVDNGKNSPIVCDTSIVITRSGAVTIKGNGYLNFPNSNGLVFGAGVSISDALIDGITIKSKGHCIDFSNNDGEEYPAYIYRSVFSNLKLISDTDCVYGGYKKNNDVLTFDLYFQNIRVKTPANAFRAISGSLRNRVENITGEVFGSYFYDFLPEKIYDSNMTYPAYNDSNTLESAKYLIYLSKRFDEIKAQMHVEIRNCNIEDFQSGVIGSDKDEWDSYDSNYYLGVFFHNVTITGGKMTSEYDNIISYPYAYSEVHLPFASTKSKVFIDAKSLLTPRCANYTLNDLKTSPGFTIPSILRVVDGYSEVLLTKSCSQLDLARINTLIQVTPQIITDADYDSSVYGFYVYKSNVHLKLATRTSFANFMPTIKYGDKNYPTDAVLPFIVTNMGENTITDSANRWSLKKGESGIFAFLSNGQYLQYHCITTVTKIQENNKLKSGTTAGRPTGISIGFPFFDTTLGKPIWWAGEKWVDSAGTEV